MGCHCTGNWHVKSISVCIAFTDICIPEVVIQNYLNLQGAALVFFMDSKNEERNRKMFDGMLVITSHGHFHPREESGGRK
jgi:hypothetical protein